MQWQPSHRVMKCLFCSILPLAAGIIRAVGAYRCPYLTLGPQVQQWRGCNLHYDKTVGVYCNTPNNPSGMMLTPEETEELANVAVAQGWWIYADEVYERLIYDGDHTPLASLHRRIPFPI